MANNLYEILGVPENATEGEIKKAYRAKSHIAHPDKGGSTDEFTPIAKAYKILSDPARKLLYDTTGQDSKPPIEQEVQTTLIQLFSQALSSEKDIEVTAFVRNVLKKGLQELPKKIKELKTRKLKLKTKRGKIKSKGLNIAHLVIDDELKNISGQLALFEQQIKVGKACLKTLKSYSEEWEELPLIYSDMSFGRTVYKFEE